MFIERHPDVHHLIVDSGVAISTVRAWRVSVIDRTLELAALLPDSMLYKTQKPQHALDAERDARDLAPLLGLNEIETDVLALLLASHDIGRLVEAGRQARGEERSPWHHGVDSENVIRPLLGRHAETRFGNAILLAIRHHADAGTVQLEDIGGDEAAWALATLVRDIDKAENFEQTHSYLEDAAYKESVRRHDWPEQLKTDPDWGTEMRCIDPARLLENFARHTLLPRSECRSYEAYMLQFLAWVFDIVHPEILAHVLNGGGPQKVRDYIDRQLEHSPAQRRYFRAALTDWRGGLLAI
jgi:hypothetical protein